MGNNSNVLSSTADLIQFRAGDSLKVISLSEQVAKDKITLYAPYLQLYYKIPLSQDIMFEPFVRLSLNHLSVRPQATYFLVGKATTYNEIITANNYLTYELAFHPGVCLSARLSKSVKFYASTAYSHNILEKNFMFDKDAEFLNITSSNNGDNIAQEFERPRIANGVWGSIGLQIIFHSNVYAHEKGYTNPAVYNREIY